ncbi:MAG: NAD-dependent protein deacetylase [Gammaproteobacteria bacterium]|nr:NAD-dependent protein deacetylase [Gammaproteobacteria bacterium]
MSFEFLDRRTHAASLRAVTRYSSTRTSWGCAARFRGGIVVRYDVSSQQAARGRVLPAPRATRRLGTVSALADFLSRIGSVAVLSGAGVSTGSGIPDYRDRKGEWKHARPIEYGPFTSSEATRRRYWARSYVGWQRFSKAHPNVAHAALAALDVAGKVDTLITQNVDRLHQRAGSRNVIDLHGDLSKVRCLDCDTVFSRTQYQQQLKRVNPDWHADAFRMRADGDAELADGTHDDFTVADCPDCGGIVKPDVVMFGESVPRDRVDEASAAVERADALLVIGSSLMVFSGFRFARQAAASGKPIVIVNLGRTRADDLATLKIEGDCADVLSGALDQMPAPA